MGILEIAGRVTIFEFLVDPGINQNLKKAVHAGVWRSAPLRASRAQASMSDWMAAVEVGNLNKLRILLERWRPVDEEDEDGCTAFQLTVGDGRVDVARLLTEHGRPNPRHRQLHEHGRDSVALANLFLELGVSAGELLDVAAEWCSTATVAVILDAGADLNRKDEEAKFRPTGLPRISPRRC